MIHLYDSLNKVRYFCNFVIHYSFNMQQKKVDTYFIPYGKTYQLKERLPKALKLHDDVELEGVVKMHGTNTAVVIDHDLQLHLQSRNLSITRQSDLCGNKNEGFYSFIFDEPDHKNQLCQLYNHISGLNNMNRYLIRITGEYCGPQINARVGINGLAKRIWLVFEIALFDEHKVLVQQLNLSQHMQFFSNRIVPITKFTLFRMRITKANNEESMKEIMRLTNDVARDCPVAKYMGSPGLGEGIVWKNVSTNQVIGKTKSKDFMSLGHSVATGPKQRLLSFAENTVTDERMYQVFAYMNEMGIDISNTKTSIPALISWMINDIASEEHEISEFPRKRVEQAICNRAVFMFKTNQDKYNI